MGGGGGGYSWGRRGNKAQRNVRITLERDCGHAKDRGMGEFKGSPRCAVWRP